MCSRTLNGLNCADASLNNIHPSILMGSEGIKRRLSSYFNTSISSRYKLFVSIKQKSQTPDVETISVKIINLPNTNAGE